MKIPKIKPNELALLYGILLGDGSLSKSKYNHYFVSIVGNIYDDYKFFGDIIVPILEKATAKNITIRKRTKQRKLEILISNKDLFNYMSYLGFPIGKKGTKLEIPKIFNKNDFTYLIQGYFATDGCLVITNNNGTIYPRIEFSSISKNLLLQVLKYLKLIGMKGNIYLSHKYTKKEWNDLFRIQFNGRKNLEIFTKRIGFVNYKHVKKFEKYNMQVEGSEPSTST